MVTLTTIIYEGNFRNILREDSWYMNFTSKYITKKRLNVNNISEISEFNNLVEKMKDKGFDFEIVYVDNFINDVNNFFNLNINKQTLGYNYTAPFFVDVLTINTPYIFNINSDSQHYLFIDDSFLEDSIKIMDDEDVIITTVPWTDYFFDENGNSVGLHEEKNNNKRDQNFWFSDVMSDQLYFSKIDKLKKCDFTNTQHLHPFPSYGGYSFEFRLCNYLKLNKKYRGIYKGNNFYTANNDKNISDYYKNKDL
jgi:hypothetical protein